MSAATEELREIVDLLREVKQLLQEVKPETSASSQLVSNLTNINRLVTTYVSLARRVGVTGPIMEFIALVQQVRLAVLTLVRSVQLFYAATGPIGWAIGLGGIALSGVMAFDVAESVYDQTRGK